MRVTHSQRMAAETEEQREARLQRMSANQRERLAGETEEQREARLQSMSAHQSERLALKNRDSETRLQRMRINHDERITTAIHPLFHWLTIELQHPSYTIYTSLSSSCCKVFTRVNFHLDGWGSVFC